MHLVPGMSRSNWVICTRAVGRSCSIVLSGWMSPNWKNVGNETFPAHLMSIVLLHNDIVYSALRLAIGSLILLVQRLVIINRQWKVWPSKTYFIFY